MPTLVCSLSVLKFCLNTSFGIYNSVYKKELILLVVPSDEVISLLCHGETKTFFLPREPVCLLLCYCGKFQLGKVSKISVRKCSLRVLFVELPVRDVQQKCSEKFKKLPSHPNTL